MTAAPRRIGDWRAIIAADALDIALTPEAERILDVPPGTRPAPRDLLALLEPEARARLAPALLREWRTGESWDLEFPCRTLAHPGRPARDAPQPRLRRRTEARHRPPPRHHRGDRARREGRRPVRRASGRRAAPEGMSGLAILAADADGRISWLAGAVRQLLGIEPEQALGMRLLDALAG